MTTTAESIEDFARSIGLTMQFTFVPWLHSRNGGEKQPSLNWKITLLHKGQTILVTDYSAGMANCPSYKPHKGAASRPVAVDLECKYGTVGGRSDGKAIVPQFADVLHSLVLDADVADYGTFEEWADSLGYDTDSRKAEAIYRACLDTYLALKNGIGMENFLKLREAVQDY